MLIAGVTAGIVHNLFRSRQRVSQRTSPVGNPKPVPALRKTQNMLSTERAAKDKGALLLREQAGKLEVAVAAQQRLQLELKELQVRGGMRVCIRRCMCISVRYAPGGGGGGAAAAAAGAQGAAGA